MRKRTTPEDDIDRLVERVERHAKGRIKDRGTFDHYFSSYMPGNLSNKQQKTLANNVFNKIRKRNPQISSKKKILVQKKKKIATTAYTLRGMSKGRIVDVHQTYITIKGKRMVRYRDRKGRFASKTIYDIETT